LVSTLLRRAAAGQRPEGLIHKRALPTSQLGIDIPVGTS